ncbi:DUF3293 domain-containing protein [Shewanella sp. SNU WT4]|uniref:DUF3293 domain-containing protein n=1 Tax=Shewanella sp. SNU WT4 TaxID=2590015 RepID=UPI00112A28E4|nr:DUF3293 domain-containing protein [Shewanella sp. SNU WT4]QDF68164.1 DUF3293 domain-containing protein [Shewanella sp. SNU WT4]
MTQITIELWRAYQSSVFLLTQALTPSIDFAIITAANPLGVPHLPGQNRLYDRQLQQDIDELRVPYRRILGASPDLSHVEASWAVILPLAEALDLGRRWQQLAIYYVSGNRLGLFSCSDANSRLDLGAFSERVTLVNELPSYS